MTDTLPEPVSVTEDEAVRLLREQLKVVPPSGIVKFINLLVYGDPGVGKTWLMGSAIHSPLTSPVLIFDVEGGMTTLKHLPGIDVIPVRSMKELTDNYNRLYNSIKNGSMYYKTVGIDSLTELADLDIKSIMKDAYTQSPDKIDPDVPDQRGWGKSRNHIRTIVRAFRDLPCHVIYTASAASQQEQDQPTKVFPGFAGKLRTEVPGFMDIVAYYFNEVDPVREVITRKFQVQGTRRVIAKDRTNSLNGLVVNPDIPMLWDLISNQGSASSQQATSVETTTVVEAAQTEEGVVTNV